MKSIDHIIIKLEYVIQVQVQYVNKFFFSLFIPLSPLSPLPKGIVPQKKIIGIRKFEELPQNLSQNWGADKKGGGKEGEEEKKTTKKNNNVENM